MMASSVGLTSAVSDYETLNLQNHYRRTVRKTEADNRSSEEEDFLPLRPRKMIEAVKNKQTKFYHVMDLNNSAVEQKNLTHKTFDHTFFDGLEQNQISVPVPEAWSPGMFVVPNPSLFITPQKSSHPLVSSKSADENVLEPQSVSKIPQPLSWSPGMMAQPNPSLFITPEKTVGKTKISDNQGGKEKSKGKENNINKTTAKPKSKYSVRFDLPASAAQDTAPDPLSESFSPITIRGSEMITGDHGFASPTWKAYSPQKAYNPSVYSDESSLDESTVSSQSTPRNRPKNMSLSSIVDSNNVADKLSCVNVKSTSPQSDPVLLQVQTDTVTCHKQNEIEQNLVSVRKPDIMTSVPDIRPQKLESSKSCTLVPTKAKVHNGKKKMKVHTKSISQTGLQCLRSSPTLYEPPPPESAVVREMKNNLLSTEYSFPFGAGTVTRDSEFEHVFARPEFNSTLKVRAELDNLHEQEVDVMKAVEATLAKSEQKKSEINEKAALYTNCASVQFRNLIDLETSVESLCDRVVRMRTTKVPGLKKATHLEKKTGESQRAPDLMEFFTSDLQKECPDLTLRGVSHVTSQLITAPQDLAFDLYRHNRMWQGISDFFIS